jgi:DNA polymerase-1
LELTVSETNCLEILASLEPEELLVFDTETTGLRPFHTSRPFSFAVATTDNSYYFDLSTLKKFLPEIRSFFEKPRKWVGQNIKFDMHMIEVGLGVRLEGEFYDTEVLGRLYESHHWKMSLDALAERYLGERKDDRVMEWLEDNKAYTLEKIPDKNDTSKNYRFDFVPLEIISVYAMKDARLTYKLFDFFMKNIDERSRPVIELEKNLTPVLRDMEHTGVLIDKEYCEEAAACLSKEHQNLVEDFRQETGLPFLDSSEFLSPLFEKLGYILPKTEKGNISVADDVLETINEPLAKLIQKIRAVDKKLKTYFLSYLFYADDKDRIHTSFRQAGTVTGRMSARDPNLQNIPSDDESDPYPIRRSFIPSEGFFFVSIDFRQMEFRLMLDLD